MLACHVNISEKLQQCFFCASLLQSFSHGVLTELPCELQQEANIDIRPISHQAEVRAQTTLEFSDIVLGPV